MRFSATAVRLVALCLLLGAVQSDETTQPTWGDACPLTCSCLLSELRDLAMHRWFTETASSNGSTATRLPVQANDVIYQDDAPRHDEIGLLRTASCVFQPHADPEEWLSALPNNVQVLTLLQAADSGHLTLGPEHLEIFTSLVALEVQGWQTESGSGEITIMSNALRPLTHLQFLHLQHVRFLGQPEEAPPLPAARFHYMPEEDEGKHWKQRRLDLQHELVFLSPVNPLPYSEYKQAQERAGLSVFAGLSNLLFLRVYQCGLKEIHFEMFDGLVKLQYLSLEGNKLLYIPDFAFYGTPNLKVLSLADNKILSMQFTNLAGLLELEKLDLSNNNISHLSELSLPPFPKLLNADLRQNPIEQVFAGTFDIMNLTDTLQIGADDVALQLKPSSLQGLKSLRYLTLHNAITQELEREMLTGIPILKELQIDGNIKSLAFDAFTLVPKLEVLTLKNCNIETVSMDSFYGLYGLISLDLSNNLLKSLPPGIFDQLHSLRELQLRNNRLTELPDDIFASVPAKMIRLDENPWHCSCAMRQWRPMAINKVKIITKEFISPDMLDKGVALQVRRTQYAFEKRVAPRCKTPLKYVNWNVFHVLRKELRCGKISARMIRKHAELRNLTSGEGEDALPPAEVAVPPVTSPEPPTNPPHPTENNQLMNPEPQHLELDNPNNLAVLQLQVSSTDSKKLLQKQELTKEKEEKLSQKQDELPQIQHEGKTLRVSKKAYKLEQERLRSEKLKKLKQ